MKRSILLLLIILPFLGFSETYKSHQLKQDKLEIELSVGKLNITPLTDDAIRITWEIDQKHEEQDFVLVNKFPTPKFKFSETNNTLIIKTLNVEVQFDKLSNSISYLDNKGKVFLSEKVDGRLLTPSVTSKESSFIAEQSFNSASNEKLFGLGQFQDGHFNLRNVSRKLIQVNSQIAIPFIYSNQGYGILWHQYGLTDFNPTDNKVELIKKEVSTLQKGDAEVTTTNGTQVISQQQSLYTGKFNLDRDGEYSFMLDMGNMESKHYLAIDGKPYLDQSNLWLPPAASTTIKLKAGEHNVEIICKSSNVPALSWKMNSNQTTFRSPNAKSLDYIVFKGQNADEVISNYRKLTGTVPMLPLWAFGFWQCRERYTSGDHLVETIKEFRKRRLPVDVIVQDWQYWGKYGWGAPKFDEKNYPNPEKFIAELHDLNAKFSISVWENLDKKSIVSKEYVDKNLYIPNSPWIDIYNPETQKTHWNTLNKNLFSLGVDSWWMDATEPENDALLGKQTYFGKGDFYRLTYPLFVSKAIYEGQRNTNPDKRVTILTRSSFPGQQRFGTINWSGDIGWDWDAFRRQIVAGLNFSLTGMPFWTTDIGGFFRPGPNQYKNKEYHDILTRWFQFGAFNPIFRTHGYQTETEPWKYGETVENNMRTMLNLRYQLMPYIYSEAWNISKNGSTMMRPMVMDFNNDDKAVDQAFQFMFGKSILVAPVTKPNITEWEVYLPKSTDWVNFYTNQTYKGGEVVKVAAPQDKIPLFVKTGSILLLGKEMQFTNEKSNDTLEVRIYKGADGKFDLYEDEGDNYNYEKDQYTLIPFIWNDKKQELEIGTTQGSFKGQLKNRTFNLILIESPKNDKSQSLSIKKVLNYKGRGIKSKIK